MAQAPALQPRPRRLSELDPAGPVKSTDYFGLVQEPMPGLLDTRRVAIQQLVAHIGQLGGNAVTSVAGKQGVVTLTTDDIVGLGLFVENQIQVY